MHDAPSLSLIDVADRYRFYSYNSLLANRCSSICFSKNFSLYFMRQVSLFGYFSHTSIIFNIFLWRFVIFFFFFFYVSKCSPFSLFTLVFVIIIYVFEVFRVLFFFFCIQWYFIACSKLFVVVWNLKMHMCICSIRELTL